MRTTRGEGPVVVVTGASAGVGRAVAQRFARDGARVGLLARGMDGLEGARRDVEQAGGKGLVLQTDVADPEAVERAAAQVEAELGPIDIWVNNAMVSVFSPFKEMTVEEFRRVTDVTYLGTVHGTMAALRRMLPRNRGSIVQVGSALAYRAIPLQSAYCGAKHAIRGFTDSIRSELIHDKCAVQICMVQLPAINTPQFGWVKSRLPNKAQPVPPIYQPEVAAEAIHFAAHHPRREMFVGMSAAKAILGNKLIPGVLDHYLAHKAYEGQQTDEPRDPNQPENLWHPVPGDHGAHGTFGERAKSSSPGLWFSQNRKWLGWATAGIVGLGLSQWLMGKRAREAH